MSYDINQTLSSPKFDLNEIFSRLCGKGGPFEKKQAELGKLVGIDQTQVSRIKGGGMPELRDHWKFSLKVLFLCTELGLITDRDLQGIKVYGNDDLPDSPKAVKAKTHRG